MVAGSPDTQIILETYQRNANKIDPIAEAFIYDLNDIITLANWSEEQNATMITLEVNW